MRHSQRRLPMAIRRWPCSPWHCPSSSNGASAGSPRVSGCLRSINCNEYAEAGGLLSYGSGLVTLSAELFRAWAELTVCTTFLLHIRKQKSRSLVKRLKRKPIHHPVVPRAPVRSLLPDQRHEPDGRYDRGCGRSVSVFC
jgi:hypothetical protein